MLFRSIFFPFYNLLNFSRTGRSLIYNNLCWEWKINYFLSSHKSTNYYLPNIIVQEMKKKRTRLKNKDKRRYCMY